MVVDVPAPVVHVPAAAASGAANPVERGFGDRSPSPRAGNRSRSGTGLVADDAGNRVPSHGPADEPNGNVAPPREDTRRAPQARPRGERTRPVPALFNRTPYGAG